VKFEFVDLCERGFWFEDDDDDLVLVSFRRASTPLMTLEAWALNVGSSPFDLSAIFFARFGPLLYFVAVPVTVALGFGLDMILYLWLLVVVRLRD